MTLAAVPLTMPLTVPLTLVRTPPAGEAGDRFGLALAVVPAAAPVLWLPPWPGMMSWVTAWTAEAAVLVAVGAGDGSAPPLDPADAGAGTLAAGTLAAGTFAAGTLAAGTAWEEAALAGAPWSLLLPGAGLPGAVLTGPEPPPSPELPPWPGTTLWAELITELATELTATRLGAGTAARSTRSERAEAASRRARGRCDGVLGRGGPSGHEHSKNKRCGQRSARVQANSQGQQ